MKAELCLGARIDDAVFSAHAWVECQDRVINDTVDVRTRFIPFERYDSRKLTAAIR